MKQRFHVERSETVRRETDPRNGVQIIARDPLYELVDKETGSRMACDGGAHALECERLSNEADKFVAAPTNPNGFQV